MIPALTEAEMAKREGITQKLYDHVVTDAPNINYDKKKRIWLPKAICIVSENPFYDFYG